MAKKRRIIYGALTSWCMIEFSATGTPPTITFLPWYLRVTSPTSATGRAVMSTLTSAADAANELLKIKKQYLVYLHSWMTGKAAFIFGISGSTIKRRHDQPATYHNKNHIKTKFHHIKQLKTKLK